MTGGPIRELFDGPLDIVGDVHGEAGALEKLMMRLGYRTDGRHPDGRRLVFVGDLVDRGEDSPAVVERVVELVEGGLAQCVLGNHELNLVVNSRKEGNGWFYEAHEDHDHVDGHFLDVPRASGSQRQAFAEWFGTLPLALERDDLRVVHACWHQASIDALRDDTRQIAEIYTDWSDRVEAYIESKGLHHSREQEQTLWHRHRKDRKAVVPMLPAIAEVDSLKQTRSGESFVPTSGRLLGACG